MCEQCEHRDFEIRVSSSHNTLEVGTCQLGTNMTFVSQAGRQVGMAAKGALTKQGRSS